MPDRPKKPYEIRERLFLFACDVIKTAQKLHQRGPIAGALSVQLVNAAMNAAANVKKADAPLIQEAGELVKIVAKIIHNAQRIE